MPGVWGHRELPSATAPQAGSRGRMRFGDRILGAHSVNAPSLFRGGGAGKQKESGGRRYEELFETGAESQRCVPLPSDAPHPRGGRRKNAAPSRRAWTSRKAFVEATVHATATQLTCSTLTGVVRRYFSKNMPLQLQFVVPCCASASL